MRHGFHCPITSKELRRQCTGLISIGGAKCQGSRTTMEDTFCIQSELEGHPGMTFVGIYDGHDGSEVSEYCSANLQKRIAALSKPTDPEALTRVFHDFDEECKKSIQDKLRPGKDPGSTAVIAIIEKEDNGNIAAHGK
jgi:serine/threonine protein phosphatase PrpC